MNYVLRRFLRRDIKLDAADTLDLRRQCREILGLRQSARYRYKQIGANSFIIEWRGLPVACVFKE